MFRFDFAADGEHDEHACSAENPPETQAEARRASWVSVPFPTALQRASFQDPVESQGLLRVRAAAEGSVALGKDADVVPGIYEGGLKVWEASLDLLHHLREEFLIDASAKSVLELGCGHGLPGIQMLLRGAEEVVFSDFNPEVLEQVTSLNVALNAREDPEIFQRAMFLAGDWSVASETLLGTPSEPRRFDVILAAETVYTPAATEGTIRMIERHLAYDGVAILAGKRYYFGTGGGTGDLVGGGSLPETLEAFVVKEVEDGRSNIRDVLHIRHRGKP